MRNLFASFEPLRNMVANAKFTRRCRQFCSFLVVLFLGTLTLSVGARRSFVQRLNPASHTSKSSRMAEVSRQTLPRIQPAETSISGEHPQTARPLVPRLTPFCNAPGFLRVLTLRSPPSA